MTTRTAPTASTRSNRLRWWALVVVCLAMFMNALDSFSSALTSSASLVQLVDPLEG
jgi:hypothetical protein